MAKQFQVDTGGTLTTNLQAYYKLEDVTEFYTGGGTLDLTNNNSVTFASGKVSNAAQFTRASSKSLSINNALGIDGGNVSISLWVKIDAQPSGGVPLFVFASQRNNTSDVAYQMDYYDPGTKQVRVGRVREGVANDFVSYNVDLVIGTWYHFILWYDGTDLRLYEGNTQRSTQGFSGSGSASSGDIFVLGTDRDISAGIYHDGMIDEVGVWSKALSSTERTDLNNSGNGQTMEDVVASSGNALFLVSD